MIESYNDIMTAVLVVQAPGGAIIGANLGAEELLGFDVESLQTRNFSELFSGPDSERIRRLMAEASLVDGYFGFEHHLTMSKASRRKILVTLGVKVRFDANSPLFVFTLTDITAESLAKEVLRVKEFTETIIQSLQECLIVTDPSGRITMANRMTLDWTGRTNATISGVHINSLFNRPVLLDRADRGADTAGSFQAIESDLIRSDGEPIPLSVTVSMLDAPEGSTEKGFVFAGRDMSEKRRAEQLDVQRRLYLNHSSKVSALRDMASGIAHEINNPLCIIAGWTGQPELVIEKIRQDPTHFERIAQVIKRNTVRIAKVIESLKTFSAEPADVTLTTTTLADLVGSALDFCRNRIMMKGIALEISTDLSAIPVVVKRGALQHAILNVLVNAYQALKDVPKGLISVQGRIVDGFAELLVQDNGHGVPAIERERIFEAFVSLSPSDEHQGLGLSIARKIMTDHGGTITLDCNSPTTCFIMRLPLAPASASASPRKT